MNYFRKLPVVIEAVLYDGTNYPEVATFMDTPVLKNQLAGESIFIQTLEGVMLANQGDWIIKGVAGEFYPCKPDIFEATYEEFEPEVEAAVAAGLVPREHILSKDCWCEPRRFAVDSEGVATEITS